jgi:phosphatidylglycerol:prolipoprotein diacylglycerol transferase
MLTYPDIDPIAFSIGPLDVHWYGLTYMVGFIGGWWLGRKRAAAAGSDWTAHEVDELVFYMALGVVLGGRIGYILFYSFGAFLDDPLILFRIKEGGMSFHGGLLGVMLALWFFGRRFKRRFFACTDFLAPLVPIGLGAGRIGNFINGELWGKPGDVPWAMQLSCSDFPRACRDLPMDSLYSPALHPSQLYEAGLEGAVLFFILWFYSAKPRPLMAVSGLFLLCYGLFRFAVEFVRVPDAHIDYLAFGWVTMGQVLTLPMLLGGLVLLTLAYGRK